MADYKQKRYIEIDEDTTVGYNYLKQAFYVTNKETTTYRKTIEEIKEVLNAIQVTTVTDEELQTIYSTDEELIELFYTWEDTGSYIRTIQFNSYNTHPLTIDCPKSRLYIMNTPIVFDLTADELITERVKKLCSYYLNKLGLHISQENMLYLYNLLISFYKPTCYNQIKQPTDKTEPLYYNNMFLSSNFNGKAKALYSCQYNAIGTTDYTLTGYVESTDTSTNTIKTVRPIDTLQIGMQIHLQGTNTTIDGTDYSADGTYTVTYTEDNTIYVSENIPVSYQFPNQVCSVASSRTQILSIQRDTRTVTLTTSVPDTLYVGDTIHIIGTDIQEEYDQTISCNGTYTIQAIEDNTITTVEELPTNFTGTTGYIYKDILLGNIKSITPHEDNTSTVLLYNTIPYNNIQYISIYNPTESMTNLYEVSVITGSALTVPQVLTEYMPDYPQVQKPVPTPETLITVADSKNEDKFPNGSFMVDNFEQVQNYIGLYKTLPVPTDDIEQNIGSKVPDTYTISLPIYNSHDTSIKLYDIDYMTCHGLYSESYSETTNTNE